MSSPLLVVEPDQLHYVGGRWLVSLPGLQGTPPPGSGQWASSAGAMGVTGVAGDATAALQQGLAGSAGKTAAAGFDYQNQDQKSGEALKPNDMVGIVKDLSGMFTDLVQTAPQLLQSFTSAFSSGLSGVASGASSLVSSLTTLAKGGGAAPALSPLNASQGALPAIENNNPPAEERNADLTAHHQAVHQMTAPLGEEQK